MPHQIQKQSCCCQEQVTVVLKNLGTYCSRLRNTFFAVRSLSLPQNKKRKDKKKKKTRGGTNLPKRLTRLARSAKSVDFPARATHVPRVRMMHQKMCNVLHLVFSLDTTVHAATRSCKILPKGQIIRKKFVQLFAQRCWAYYHLRVACSGCRKLFASTFRKNKDLLRV